MKYVYPESLSIMQQKIKSTYELVITSTVSNWTITTVSDNVNKFHQRLLNIALKHHQVSNYYNVIMFLLIIVRTFY